MHLWGDQQEKTLSSNAEIILSIRKELHFAGEQLFRSQFNQKKTAGDERKYYLGPITPCF
jgi:hypothetical protein